jgi:hypothetical protein
MLLWLYTHVSSVCLSVSSVFRRMFQEFQLKGRLRQKKTSGPLRSEKASSSPLACTSSTVVATHTGTSGLQPVAVERWPKSAWSCGRWPAERNAGGGWRQGRMALHACGRGGSRTRAWREMEQHASAHELPDASHAPFLKS